ncbi:hypothetical protein ABXN37_12765 [Piscinibacter sakaiensis]|uniref:Uncharacterized protein n=1 Tax=Piscinibacter sakaiensis TaxID=1547922 RepID=A0A0K8P039_PISS1|nr:hypothetical protein [Piscinibacter sakaiensis]GAP36017.1 hypothetical protein ISF6_1857 [Piscinibacter sakaiensis]
MGDSADILRLAARLERAYRLALEVHDRLPSPTPDARQAAAELVAALDDARVDLLRASRPEPSVGCPSRDRFSGGG